MARRTPAQYNWDKLEFDETLLKKHFTSQSGVTKKYVVVHHSTIVGKGDGKALDTMFNVWQSREASAHYGVDGSLVRQYVWDKDYAWATGSTAGNRDGISIEHTNSAAAPKWTVADATWKTGARLVAHLHKAYKMGRPVSGTTLRKHSSFVATACPGPFMDSIWSKYVAEAQRVYDEITGKKPAPAPKPEPKAVRFRVGTLNIPLDAAKLPDGKNRVKWAAKAVHDANLHILACQELDRGYKGDTWYYARLMLLALREHDKTWRIVKPTTAHNENVTFYRPGKAKLKRRLDDVILTSPAGGRHASRSTYTIGGVTVAVRNTHLVQGSGNGASREQQGKQLAAVSGASTIILGDFNQKALPAALAEKHKTARDCAESATNADFGTYAKWGATKALQTDGAFLDHIIVPKRATVHGFTVVGIAADGTFVQPRFSDHQLTIASISFPAK